MRFPIRVHSRKHLRDGGGEQTDEHRVKRTVYHARGDLDRHAADDKGKDLQHLQQRRAQHALPRAAAAEIRLDLVHVSVLQQGQQIGNGLPEGEIYEGKGDREKDENKQDPPNGVSVHRQPPSFPKRYVKLSHSSEI